jgi:hypothetical protein
MIRVNFDYRTAGDESRRPAKRERRALMNKREQLDGRWLQLVA